jgi:membrane protein DedA with SNARE-associated domain
LRGVQHFIGSYGYVAILLLMIAESACIPVPSELTMPLGGALAAGAVAGVHLSLLPVIAVGVAGNLVGSYIAFAVGLYGGRSVVRRSPRILGGPSGVERAQRWFDRYGGRAVFFGRLLPAIRTFISLPAGFARMPALRFGLYTVAGCVPWITGLAWAGYATGANWRHVDSALRGPTYVVAGVFAVLVAGAIIIAVRARRRRQHEGAGGVRQHGGGGESGAAQHSASQQTGADHGPAHEIPLRHEQRKAG